MASTDELTAVPPGAPPAPVPGQEPAAPAPVGLRVVCAVVGLLFAAPLGYLAWRTLTGDVSLGELYTSDATLVPLRNTLVLATATAASTAVVGTALAWLTTRTDLPLRRLWAVLAALPLVFPSFVGALALLAAVAPGGLLDGPLGWLGVTPSRPEGFAGAWMVLKRVENSLEYRRLLEDTLLSVARARGCNSLLDAGFEQVEGFLFVSSPNSTTPFHLDSEDNFFVHIHGEKFFTIYDNTDRTIVDDAEIERSMTKHRNLKFDESFAARVQQFHLFAGDGCYVPYQWPHWVRWRSRAEQARRPERSSSIWANLSHSTMRA